jgi:ribosomal-protein-alanine N-acetyltransferase
MGKESKPRRKRRLPVRLMRARDSDAVLEIERLSFPPLARWGAVEFTSVLSEPYVRGIVAVDDAGTVAGFAVYEPFKSTIEVLSLAVHPKHRRCGHGRRLLATLCRMMTARKRSIFADVIDDNLEGHLFFRACGFTATEVVPIYYGRDERDAYRFTVCRQFSVRPSVG